MHPETLHHDASRDIASWCIARHFIMMHPETFHHDASRDISSWCIPRHCIMVHPETLHHDESRDIASWCSEQMWLGELKPKSFNPYQLPPWPYVATMASCCHGPSGVWRGLIYQVLSSIGWPSCNVYFLARGQTTQQINSVTSLMCL